MARIEIHVDGRTESMDDQVLDCRGERHRWVKIPQTKSYRERLLKTSGLFEVVKRCECGVVWTQRFDVDSWDRVHNQIDYSGAEGYLAPKGTGRLSRLEAFKARVARDNPDLFKLKVH